MPVPGCRHIKENGVFCQRLALRGRRYCYSHLRLRGCQMRMAREIARQQARPLLLPPLDDLHAVEFCITQVAIAVAFKRMDRHTAWLLLYALQQAGTNLRFMEQMAASAPPISEQEQVEEYPGFEAEFGLPEGFDLEQSPETAFPPQTVEPEPSPYRSNPWHYINPEDVELEELLKTKGEEAYQKRLRELSDQSWKQTQREKRKVNEARWVLEAHRRNFNLDPPLTPEQQREHDLKVIADYDKKFPPPVKAAAPASPEDATGASEAGPRKQPSPTPDLSAKGRGQRKKAGNVRS